MKKQNRKNYRKVLARQLKKAGGAVAPLFLLAAPLASQAAEKAAAPAPESAEDGAERVNVEKIKEKYWARGDESELGVVQNRTYSKNGKFELGAFGGILTTNPFLSTTTLGLNLGYHFSEYFALQLVAMKASNSNSSAYESYQAGINSAGGVRATPGTNPVRSYYGTEGNWSFLYGKLSVVGKSIIYYDMYFAGGVGVMNTLTGNNVTPEAGIGQRVFLSKTTTLKLDYRLMRYTERIPLAGFSTTTYTNNTNYANSITLGVSFLLGSDPAPSGGSR